MREKKPRRRRSNAEGEGPPAPSRRSRTLTLLLALSAAAFALRVVPAWDVVFPAPGEIRLLGVDSYYHLRHARFAAAHFPRLQRWDIASHYPTGERSNQAGVFDLSIAALALVGSGGAPSAAAVERTAAVVPALLGALSLPALYWLARGFATQNVALLACALFALYPGFSLGRTLLGYADHHAAEMLLAIVFAGGLVRCVRAGYERRAPPWWRPAFLEALGLVLLLFTWPGAPLHLVIAAGALVALGSFELARGIDPLPTARAGLRYGSGVLLPVALVGLAWPDAVLEIGRQRELIAACVLLALAPAALLAAARLASARGVPRIVCGVAVVLVPCAAVVLAMRTSKVAAQLVAGLLAAKTSLVEEQRAVDPGSYWLTLGPVGLLALAALPAAVGAAWRRQEARLALVPLAVGTSLIALWWRVHDYDYYVPPFAALLAAFTLGEAARVAKARFAPAARQQLALALAVALIAPIWPLGITLRPWHDRTQIEAVRRLDDGWVQAMRWLESHTPAPSLAIDAPTEPWRKDDFAYPAGSYGVLPAWEFGNIVAALGRRPASESRGFSQESFVFFLAEDEPTGMRLLCPTCRAPEEIRYVIIDARSLGDYFLAKVRQSNAKLERYQGPWTIRREGGREVALKTHGGAYRRTLAARLLLDDGSGLGHFRLVYDSPHESYLTTVAEAHGEAYAVQRRAIPISSPAERERYVDWATRADAVETPAGLYYDGVLTSSVKIFERVDGARLRGRTSPGARIEARLALHSRATGRSVQYRSGVDAGADGRFELVVAYATAGEGDDTALRATGPYSVRVTPPGGNGERMLAVDVSEDAVHGGAGGGIDLGEVAAAFEATQPQESPPVRSDSAPGRPGSRFARRDADVGG